MLKGLQNAGIGAMLLGLEQETVMELRINMNGDSAEELSNQAIGLHESLQGVRKALRSAWPHGRNYQTCEDPRAALRSDHIRFVVAVKHLEALEELGFDLAETIVDQIERKGSRDAVVV
jgi:hypothetical protein